MKDILPDNVKLEKSVEKSRVDAWKNSEKSAVVGEESRANEEEGTGDGEGRQNDEAEGAGEGEGRQHEEAGLSDEQGVPASINLNNNIMNHSLSNGILRNNNKKKCSITYVNI